MIVAHAVFDIKPGCRDAFIRLAQETIEATHQKDGNISYTLLKSIDDETTLVYVEVWEDDDAIQRHLKHPAYIKFKQEREPYINSPTKTALYNATTI